ncbi:MAG: thiamine pyrophosphate-dependent enzyme, partial [Gemmatimonadota bacterium]|nr:thiamine pyrophosphate-dependent enzyme [Gemmatimonadota bacterium]
MNVETAPALSDPDLAASDLDDLGLGREDYRTLYHTMRLQREFEERVYRLFRQGRLVGAAYAGAGHEAIAAGSAYALGDADILVPMHRVIGAHFLRGHTARDMMCQYLGRANGPTAGKDGNMHCGNWDHHIVGMISHLGA